jgi:hypothetical protein
MRLQHDTSADVKTSLVSADGVLVRLLFLICFSFWDVVREGGNASPWEKRSRAPEVDAVYQ